MSFFVNILALAVPVFTMQVYDRVVGHAGISTLAGLVLGMFFVLAFDYILRQSRSRILQRVALRVDVTVGRQVFEKFISLPLATLESKPGAHWQSLFRDVDIVRNTLSGASAVLVADLPFAVLFFVIICVVALPIVWVLGVLLPVFLLVAWRSSAVMANANRDERDASQSRDSLITEMINGRTTIKALALDRAIRPIWEERHAENIERSITRGGKADGYTNLGSTLTMLTTICMTSIGSIAIIEQHLTMGGLIAANMLSGRLIGPLNQLVNQWRTYSSFKQAAERLGQFFNDASERMESEIKLDKPRGEISVENVSFSYVPDGAPTVDNVTLKIEQGGVNALVGRNGSGKTTLLKILQGLYLPTSGRVLLDGADISQFSRAELATWIGYVPQENVLFAGSIRENIAHRIPESTDEEIIRAAKAAGIHQFIIDQPDGYATNIGEAGQRLSGGQRQRISIARALVGQPPVLLLDEPSSSLDRQAEHDLRKTLEEIGKTCTVVIVTHSPVLLAACRDLTALDRGRVALTGPAADILPRLFGAGAKPAAAPPPADAKAPPKKRATADTKAPVKAVAEKAVPAKPPVREQAPAKKAADPSPLLQPATVESKPAAVPPAKKAIEPSPLLRAVAAKPEPVVAEPPAPVGKVAEAPAKPTAVPTATKKAVEPSPLLRAVAAKPEPVVAEPPAPVGKVAEAPAKPTAVPPATKKAVEPSPLLRAVAAKPEPVVDEPPAPAGKVAEAPAKPAAVPPAAKKAAKTVAEPSQPTPEPKPAAEETPVEAAVMPAALRVDPAKSDAKPKANEPRPARKAAEAKPGLRPVSPETGTKKPAAAAKTAKPTPDLRPVAPDRDRSAPLPDVLASITAPSPLLQTLTPSNEDDVPAAKKRKTASESRRPAARADSAAPPPPPKPVTKPILRVAPVTRSAEPAQASGKGNGKTRSAPSSGTRPRLVVHEAGKRTGTNGMSLPPARAEGTGE